MDQSEVKKVVVQFLRWLEDGAVGMHTLERSKFNGLTLAAGRLTKTRWCPRQKEEVSVPRPYRADGTLKQLGVKHEDVAHRFWQFLEPLTVERVREIERAVESSIIMDERFGVVHSVDTIEKPDGKGTVLCIDREGNHNWITTEGEWETFKVKAIRETDRNVVRLGDRT